MTLQIGELYFFIHSLSELSEALILYPEFADTLIDAFFSEPSLLFEFDNPSIGRLTLDFPQYEDRFVTRMTQAGLLDFPLTPSSTLGQIIKREKLINSYSQLFPSYAQQFADKKISVNLLLEKPLQNINELFWLITTFPDYKGAWIQKALGEYFDTVFRNYDAVDDFLKKFPEYHHLIANAIFEPPALDVIERFIPCFNSYYNTDVFIKLATKFDTYKKELYSLLIKKHLLRIIKNFSDFKAIWITIPQGYQDKLLDAAFTHPDTFQRLIRNDTLLNIFCGFLGSQLTPYLRSSLNIPLLWRRYLTSSFTLTKLFHYDAEFASELLPLILEDKVIFNRLFKDASNLHSFLKKTKLPLPQGRALIQRAVKWNHPAQFFKGCDHCLVSLGTYHPAPIEKVLKIALKQDETFFQIFTNWENIKQCAAIFPQYQEGLIRKLIKDERHFNYLISRGHSWLYNTGLLSTAEAFPRYTLFRSPNPEKRIQASREWLASWVAISQSSKNPYSHYLNKTITRIIGEFAADSEVYSARTASEVVLEAFRSQEESSNTSRAPNNSIK